MATRAADLLTLTPQGLYCPGGDFHVDPTRPVPRALITHGHSDHARSGHAHVLATEETLAIRAGSVLVGIGAFFILRRSLILSILSGEVFFVIAAWWFART